METYIIKQFGDGSLREHWNPTVWEGEPVGFEWITQEEFDTRFPPPPPPEPVEPPVDEEREFVKGMMEAYNGTE